MSISPRLPLRKTQTKLTAARKASMACPRRKQLAKGKLMQMANSAVSGKKDQLFGLRYGTSSICK
jgi:hypothetical protein